MPVFVGAGTSSFMKGSEGVGISTLTTTQRDALSGVENGTFIYNTTISLMQYWDGSAWKSIDSPPTITSIEVDGRAASTSEAVDDSAGGNISVVINGSNFDTTSGQMIFEASSGSNITPASITRNNTSKFTVTAARSDFLEANDPYAIKITNGSGLAATLANAIDVNRPPTFATATDTNIGFVYNTLSNFSSLTTVASTDPESDTITHTISSGTLPNGMSLQTNGTFTGTCSGLPTSRAEYTFTVQAATATWTITRQFKIDAAADAYTEATGGTITTDGDYKVHTFNSSGNFVVSSVGTGTNGDKVRYLVVAGGGGGNAQSANEGNHTSAGGGGAGGMRFNSAYDHTITATTYAITVGGGGSGASSSNVRANSGSDSTFHNVNSDGGGYAGDSHTTQHGDSGGSGGGAGTDFDSPPTVGNGGSGNQPNTSPSQGNPGGNGQMDQQSGGGGGAGATGQPGDSSNSGKGGDGGDGLQNDITGTNTWYAGGGGGGAYTTNPSNAGSGGQGGGGQCGTNTGGANGGTNLGGGGGGINQTNGHGGASGSGGSGVVIIRYKYQ